MKKLFFIAATAAVALASCSSDDALEANGTANDGNMPVAFDSYMARTRATYLTGMDDVPDKVKGIKQSGFGVFAYEQGTLPVETYTNSLVTPNFFNNEKVTFTDPNWVYGYKNNTGSVLSGVKYWPNNPGSMLSFYAYAPYMEKLPTDPITEGCRLVLSGANNGPAIQYIMPKNLADAVDLCWGSEYGSDKAPVNKEKPSITDKTKFNFKHAMARYGFNIQVWSDKITDNYPDPTDHEPSGMGNLKIEDGTTIKIESVKLIGTFAKEGVLRLYDGSWDAEIATTSTYELQPSFNPAVSSITGDVAYAEIPLLTDNDTYVMMIPGARFKIQITYTVKTADDKINNGAGSTVTNTLESEMYTAKEGVATDFHLNLGMTTVKFDAVVTDWNEPANKIEIDLPANALERIAVVKEYKTVPFNMSYNNKWIGESTVEPAVAGNADKFYYNILEKVLKYNNGSAWAEATAPVYMANYTIYANTSTGWELTTAPKWIYDTTNDRYYQLVNNVYEEVANYVTPTTARESTKAIAMEDPATGLYWLTEENGLYYYVHQNPATAAASYTYSDFIPTGTTTVTGNTVTTTYASGSVSADKHEIMNDLARYLGALYRAGGVKEIQWNSNTYEWNPTAAGNLKGSNWWNTTTNQTLVKEIKDWFGSNPSATQITIKCDDVEMILQFVQE